MKPDRKRKPILRPNPQLDAMTRFRPNSTQVDDLIQRAARHPLGLDFLLNGAQDSVAAVFSVHAFVVDEARARQRGV